MTPDEVRRIAMISVHTSPLEQPGTGDAGGMNVYVAEVAKQLARRGREVDIFTRGTTAAVPPRVQLAPGVTVRHIMAGPYEGLAKRDLPGQLCAFAAGVMRAGAARPEGYYDVVHSHYWLSGQVGWLAADRWRAPLVHSMHTMARVKNAFLATGDEPEPVGRVIGETQVVAASDRLVANTAAEAGQLSLLYGADPGRVSVVPPGVDLDVFTPAARGTARQALGLDPHGRVLLFVGRIQPLKAPDLLVRAASVLLDRHPDWHDQLTVGVLGGPSGSGVDWAHELHALVADLGLGAQVRFVPPVDRATLAQWYRAADLLAVPSYNESFGMVALEAQACGTPVVAAAVGGLPTAVGPGGLLVDGHDVKAWARTLESLLLDEARRARLGRAGVAHAAGFGWGATTERLLRVYGEARRTRFPSPITDAFVPDGVPAALIP